MKHECKITVQEKYLANPKSGPCHCFKARDTFLLKRTLQKMLIRDKKWG